MIWFSNRRNFPCLSAALLKLVIASVGRAEPQESCRDVTAKKKNRHYLCDFSDCEIYGCADVRRKIVKREGPGCRDRKFCRQKKVIFFFKAFFFPLAKKDDASNPRTKWFFFVRRLSVFCHRGYSFATRKDYQIWNKSECCGLITAKSKRIREMIR